MRMLKPNILALSEYVVEQDVDRIKLNQNESPEDIPSFLKQQILERMEFVSWNRYPPGDARALIEAIASDTGFPASGIIVGNGSNEMIQTLVYSTCDSSHRIVIIQPGFSVYKRVADIMNIEVIEVPLCDDFSFDTKALIKAGQDARIMFLATPNNPTGTTLNLSQIKHIAESVPCIVAVDEAYYEFYKETAQSILLEHDNIVILRTFSKALRLASLRLGYLLGPEVLINEFRKVRLPFSVGVFQQIAGEIMLKNKKALLEYAEQIKMERKRVFNELQNMESVHPVPSLANFILFESQRVRARPLFEEFFNRGVVIRYFGGQRLENMLRVTIGTPEENDAFLHILRDVIRRRGDESGAL